MKSGFAFIALPISALVAPSTFAVQYLTVDEAQRAIFPGKSFTAASVKLTPAQRKAIEQTSGVRVLRDEQQVWRERWRLVHRRRSRRQTRVCHLRRRFECHWLSQTH